MTNRTISEYQRMQSTVERVLMASEGARNSDKLLIFKVLSLLGNKVSFNTNTKKAFLELDSKHIPSFETITRCRRYWQNKRKMYLPTEHEVARQRRIKKEEIKEYYKGEVAK